MIAFAEAMHQAQISLIRANNCVPADAAIWAKVADSWIELAKLAKETS